MSARAPPATSDPDATIMLRHDRATLWTLPLRRQISGIVRRPTFAPRS